VTVIRGIAWDHRRCWGPLDGSIAGWKAQTGTDVVWDRRSLYSFGEGDLADYAARYDLVIYDHPFVGDAAERGWLLDLAPMMTAEDLAGFDRDEVGASWRSYAYRGGVYALPIDTAAQTAASRPDLLDRHGEAAPQTFDEVIALGQRLARKGSGVGWPAIPTDMLCTFLSVAASMGLDPGRGDGPFVARADAEIVVGHLRRLLQVAHPASATWNPIRCLDHMSATDEVAYVPYLFNYVNYATAGRIRFGASPRVAVDRPSRTLLGGAGIGVSASSANPQAALAYALHLSGPVFQEGPYVDHGGQPGSRTAWTSERANRVTNGFFRDTLGALDAAWLRPTLPGFLPLFHAATLRLQAVLTEGAPAADFAGFLSDGFARLRDVEARA
jgi:multiple sugar transport system substrate-binding protein